jgi:hypothetical protein
VLACRISQTHRSDTHRKKSGTLHTRCTQNVHPNCTYVEHTSRKTKKVTPASGLSTMRSNAKSASMLICCFASRAHTHTHTHTHTHKCIHITKPCAELFIPLSLFLPSPTPPTTHPPEHTSRCRLWRALSATACALKRDLISRRNCSVSSSLTPSPARLQPRLALLYIQIYE